MSDDKPRAVEVVDSDTTKPRRRRCCRHWWAYTLAAVVGVVVIAVPVLILVIIPKIVQDKIDSAQLVVNAINLTNTEPTSFRVSIDSTLVLPGNLVQATVDGFNGSLYLEDLPSHTPFVTLPFPPTSASLAQQDISVSLDLPITNLDSFTTFCAWVVANQTLRVTVAGDTFVHLSGISHAYPVTFTKTLTLNGLNNFSGLNVTSATISLPKSPTADNLHGFITIPNPSLLTLDVGNTSFTGSINGTNVGIVNMDNLILSPGANNVSIRANLNQLEVIETVGLQPYCRTGILPFSMTGKNVTKPEGELTYFASALSKSTQTVDINVGAVLKEDLGYTVKCAKT